MLLQNVVTARARGETAELFYERARKHDDGDERAEDFEGLIAGEGDGSGLTVDDFDAVEPGGHLRHVGGEEGELQARRGGELRRRLGQGGGEGGAGAFVDALTGDGRVQTLGGVPGDGTLDFDGVWRWGELLGFGRGDLIAGDEGDGDIVMGSDEGVEGGLADDLAVEAGFPDGAGVVAVAEDGAAGADGAVVAKEEDGVEGSVEPFHHVHGLVLAGDEGSAAMEQIGLQVAHGAMGVVDYEGVGSGGKRAVDGGVELAKEQAATKGVVVAADHDLVPVYDAGDALEVGGDEDFHSAARPFRCGDSDDEVVAGEAAGEAAGTAQGRGGRPMGCICSSRRSLFLPGLLR